MFDNLGRKLQGVVRKVSGNATITEENIREALREVRLALLEADVHYQVVKDFVARTREAALGEEVLEGVNPAQQFVKLVHEQMVQTMGGSAADFHLEPERLNVIVLLGLQGSGKTTFSAKLAAYLEKRGFRPMLAACDIYRPAAIAQLQTVGAQVGVPVFEQGTERPVPEIARAALAEARAQNRNLLIIDTAGRLHIDEMRMDELEALRQAVQPRFTFLVADAMTGQDAVASAGRFHEQVGIDGVCLTKLDGDARGGAALSINQVTGRPIYFAGSGERLDELEVFHPDRMASRILGMGDVLSLVEKAQEAFDEREAQDLQKKIRKESFTFEDFLKQMERMKKMGSMKKLFKMIPGAGEMLDELDDDELETQLARSRAIIQSMTPEERNNPKLLNGSRRARIAKGSGNAVQEVNRLVKDFEGARKMMSGMLNGQMPGAGGGAGAGRAGAAKRGGSKPQRKSKKDLKRQKKKKGKKR